MQPTDFPGGLSEIDFVDAYRQSALRKPQVVADSALRSIVLAGQSDRILISAVIAEQLAEACRRLNAVWLALSNRTHTVGRSLLSPLPGAAEWRTFAQQAGTLTAEQILRELSIGEDGLEAAQRLRSQADLGGLADLVEAAEGDTPMVLVPGLDNGRMPAELWLAGTNRAGQMVAASIAADEGEAATLADLTADMCSIARGFLGAYVGSRRSAGRRP